MNRLDYEFDFHDPDEGKPDSQEHDSQDVDSQDVDSLNADASYICNSCGEEIVVPLDLSQGQRQEYVEDCPVCCNPNVIFVEFDVSGQVDIWSRAE